MNRSELMKRIGIAGIWMLVVMTAEVAFAQDLRPINNVTTYIQNFLTGNFAKSVSVIGLCGSGYLFYAGRIALSTLMGVVGGIALIFGSAAIVDTLSQQALSGN